MSTALDILVRARDEASATIHKVEASAAGMSRTMTTGMNTSAKSAETMGEKFKAAGKWIGGAIGIVGVEQFADKALEAFDMLEKSEHRLDMGLEAIGRGGDLDGIMEWSKGFSLQTGINQGDIVDMVSKLGTMGHAFFEAAGPQSAGLMEGLTEGMTNLAAATGKSAGMLMRSLGPAIINTPLKAVANLQKYGAITDEVANQVKALGVTSDDQLRAMVQAGDITQEYAEHVRSLTAEQRKQEASTKEITALQKQYSGEAAGTATPLEKLKNMWNQVELAAGKLISGALGWLLDHGGTIVSWVKTFAVAFGPLIAAWVAYTAATKIAAAAQAIFNLVMDANPIALIAIAVSLLAVLVIRNWDTIKRVTLAVWGSIQRFFVSVWNKIKAPVMLYVRFLQAEFRVAKAIVMTAFRAIAAVIKVAWNGIKAAAVAVFNFFRDGWRGVTGFARTAWNAIKSVWNAAKGFFSGIWDGIVAGAKGAFNGVIAAINWLIDQINKVQVHIHIDPPGPGSINFDWNGLGLGHITPLAAGGIAMRPTLALIGEAGPEAVVPLNGNSRFGGPGRIDVRIDRRRWVSESDYETAYRGF